MEEAYEKRGYLHEPYRLFRLRDDRGPSVEFHYHDFHKIVFLFSGGGTYAIEGDRYSLLPGDIVFVPRGSVHRPEIDAPAGYERAILYLTAQALPFDPADGWTADSLFARKTGYVLRLTEREQQAVRKKLDETARELASGLNGARTMAMAYVMSLLVSLDRFRSGNDIAVLSPETGDEKIRRILRYLNENLTEPMGIEELAEHFYVSKYHMMRRFREETGMPIHVYLNEKRLILARERIAAGESATAACYACGFQSYSAFARAYGKRFGVSPKTARPSLLAEHPGILE